MHQHLQLTFFSYKISKILITICKIEFVVCKFGLDSNRSIIKIELKSLLQHFPLFFRQIPVP